MVRPGRNHPGRLVAWLAGATVALAWTALTPVAGGAVFSAPTLLPNGDPSGMPFYNGGEPSIAFDPNGDGHVYVVAPQSIPAVLSTPGHPGVAYWASDDHGVGWPRSGLTGSLTGGADSDVAVMANHTVLAADLEAAAAAICTSTDFAHSFNDCNGGIAGNQQGPNNDRPWLTTGASPGTVFLTYHSFSGNDPILEKSTDGGQSFSMCTSLLSGTAAQNFQQSGATLVSKPVVGNDGTLYVEIGIPDGSSNPQALMNHLYMAVVPQGQCSSTPAPDYDIYDAPGADLGRIFQSAAIDGGGELYVLAAGPKDLSENGSAPVSPVYLFTSTDGGQHWSPPIRVSPPDVPGNVFPWISGGQGPGEAVLSWYGTTTSGDIGNTNDQWRFYAAETYDGGQTFTYSTVTPVFHYGDICTAGASCSTGNRNLADFASNTVDPANGCAALAIPGDPYNTPGSSNTGASSAYVSLQQDNGDCLTAANAGRGAGAGGGGAMVLSAQGSVRGCLDRVAPRVRLRGRPRASRRGLTLHGLASDRGCGPRGNGRVARVDVALAKLVGGHCRFLRSNGTAGRPTGCRRPRSYLRAHGTRRFSLSFRHGLAPGRYLGWVRAVDGSGNAGRRSPSDSFRLQVR